MPEPEAQYFNEQQLAEAEANRSGGGLESATPEKPSTNLSGLVRNAREMHSLQGVLVGVIGTGSTELSEAEKAAAAEVGQLLARTKAQLVCGLEPGIDHAVLRSYIEAVGDTPDQGNRIHLLATEKELRGYTVRNIPVQKVTTTTGEEFIDELLVRVSAIIVIGGRGFCYRIYQEAQARNIGCIPIPETEGDARKIHSEISNTSAVPTDLDWFEKELKNHATETSPQRWVVVAGPSENIDSERRLRADCERLGEYLAEVGVGLRTGCRTGVDETVAQAYMRRLSVMVPGADPRRYLVQVARRRDSREHLGRVEYAATEEIQFDQLLDGVSALFLLNGGRGTMQTAAEAARRGIVLLPIRSTGRAARRVADRISMRQSTLYNITNYHLDKWGSGGTIDQIETKSAFRQLLDEPRYPNVHMPVVDIPEDATVEEIRKLLGMSQKAQLA